MSRFSGKRQKLLVFFVAAFGLVDLLLVGFFLGNIGGKEPNRAATSGLITAPINQQGMLPPVLRATPTPANPSPALPTATPTEEVPTVAPTVSATPTEIPTPTVALTSSPTSQVLPTSEPTATLRPVQPDPALANRKLTLAERNELNKIETDLRALNSSIERINQLRIQIYPGQADWNGKLQKEVTYWQGLLNYYKTTPFSTRLGTQVLPNWLAALARLDRAGQLFTEGYHDNNGIKVSQGDQEVAFAETELPRVAVLITKLKNL